MERELALIGGESKDNSEIGGFAYAGEDIQRGAPTITVRTGDRVTITFENTHGQYFGESISHDLAIVTDKDDRAALDEPVWGAATSILEPGESETITFTPDTSGTYYLVCRIPGHVSRGMWGEFVVGE